MTNALCHPDDIRDDIRCYPKSSVSHPIEYVIRMTYDVAISHPNAITNFQT